MGPVEGAEAPGPEQREPPGATGGRRKLYRLREGALIAGVSTGIAAYTRLDLSLVRIALVLAVILSFWFVALAYIVAMFVIPTADTPEDWRAAHGLPATAQEVIDNAKARFADFEAKQDWWVWQRQGPARAPAADQQRFTAPAAPAAGIAVRLFAGLGALSFGAIGAAATLVLFVVIISLITNGAVFGFAPLTYMPLWLSLLLVTLVYAVVSEPVRALRVQCYKTVTGMDERQSAAIDGVMSLAFVTLGAIALYQFAPPVREVAGDFLVWLRSFD
jgi:phage shock protein PspC (stress-responsive transcriptional regulator)